MNEKKNEPQIPEAILKMVEQMSEKLGASVNVEVVNMAESGNPIASAMKLPGVVTNMYLLAQLIGEECDKDNPGDVDLLTVVALVDGIIQIAQDGMPEGFFDRLNSRPDIVQQRKDALLTVAKDMVKEVMEEVAEGCDCPNCQARREEAAVKGGAEPSENVTLH